MYARVTRIKGDPARTDEAIEQLKAQLVPLFKQQTGYLGVIAVGNRETGEAATTTYWDSMANLKASEGALFAARDKLVGERGGELLSFHRCEVAFSERKAAPKAGTFLRAVTLSGITEAKRDQMIERHKVVIAPELLKQPGAIASVLMLDYENGIGFAVSSFESAAQRDAAIEAMEKFIAANPGGLGVQRTDATLGETFHVDLPVLATSG